MLIAGKNNDRFLKIKSRKSFVLSIPTTFITITTAENKYGGLCAPILVLAVLVVNVLYGDLALHTEPGKLQP